MLAWKVRNKVQEEIGHSRPGSFGGANRRAINLIPLPVSSDGHELAQTKTVRFHQLLISIEGNQRTCVLKVISPKKKSRSALLIFRGRVLGCLYGRRDLQYHFFHQDAHSRAMADLATPGNILDAYNLPEDLALAAASLFHGQILEFNRGYNSHQLYETAVHQILSFGLPGCVVVSSAQDEMVAMIYIANGRILGVYSSRDGWVESTMQGGLRYIDSTPQAKVVGSILAIRTLDDVARMGFSLTGLADRNHQFWKQTNRRAIELDPASLRPIDSYEAQHANRVSAAHYTIVRHNQMSKYHRHAHSIWV